MGAPGGTSTVPRNVDSTRYSISSSGFYAQGHAIASTVAGPSNVAHVSEVPQAGPSNIHGRTDVADSGFDNEIINVDSDSDRDCE